VKRVPEVVPGYPDRILPVDDKAAAILKKRTLTNLYNERPAWLDNAHGELDAAVAAAYGWPADLPDEEILERLFRLNQDRAAQQIAAAE
jgi:type II restriction/modification system DNA methylase subunit YeeA